jgi:hypothetical protein
VRIAPDLGGLLTPPSPPAEKATASKDQAGARRRDRIATTRTFSEPQIDHFVMVITSAEARVWHLVGSPSTREQHNAGGNFYAQDGSLLTSVEGNGTCGQFSIRPLHVNGLSIPNFRWTIIFAAKLAGSHSLIH